MTEISNQLNCIAIILCDWLRFYVPPNTK